MSAPIIEVDGLTKRFGQLTAVDDLSFEVESGSTTGLIGPNGAGKSTVFNLISGLLDVDDGEIVFQGERITDYSPPKRARLGIGRTFQDSQLFPELTVTENLILASADEDGHDTAMDLLETVGLDALKHDLAMNLSYGQSKLLGLARAFMVEPDLILFDEPFSGINPSLKTTVLDVMNTLQEDHGSTYLIIEHDIDLVDEICSNIIVMDSGRKLVEGSPEEVLRDERVLDVYFGEA